MKLSCEIIILTLCLLAFNVQKNLISAQKESNICGQQMTYIDENYERGVIWARKIKNAWGSFPSGVFSGNRFDFGNFDQCIEFYHSSNSVGDFNGQFCTIFFSYELFNTEIINYFAPQLHQ